MMTTKRPSTVAFDLGRIERESFVRQIVFHRVLASTNDLALELAAKERVLTPLLVLAEKQTAGRGRGSNRWWSRSGAITFSLVIDAASLHLQSGHWPRVSLTAAVAVCRVLEPLVPHIPCGIRWPNDVFMASRKVCGILPELLTQHDPSENPNVVCSVPSCLVLGVGINVNNPLQAAPPDVRAVGTSLFDLTGELRDLSDFLIQVLRELSNGLDALATGNRELANAWSQRCMLQGRMVELKVGPRRVRGLCQGVDSEGALVLQNQRGTERFFGGLIVSVE